MDLPALLRLLHLTSPALPIGSFAYSQGLEHAVERAWVTDEDSAATWILGLLTRALPAWDVPVLARLMEAWQRGDDAGVRRWNDVLFASRGSAELQAEDQRLGNALARVLVTLQIARAGPWTNDPRATLATPFALASVQWQIPATSAAAGLLFAWTESQVGAALRLVPLGQSAGVRILNRATAEIPAAVERGLALGDDDLGFAAPAQAVASALHETQYARIFRS